MKFTVISIHRNNFMKYPFHKVV